MHYHSIYDYYEDLIYENMGFQSSTRPTHWSDKIMKDMSKRMINPNRNFIIDRQEYYDFELKSGQTVITRDGTRCLIVYQESQRRYWAVTKSGMHLGSVEYGLIRKGSGYTYDDDIVKVYDCQPYFNYTNLSEDKLVWSEEQELSPVEVTLEEIANKFNVPVDKLRIKD